MQRTIATALLIAYLAILADLTLLRFPQSSPEPNLVPMATVLRCWDAGPRSLAVNVGGNLAAFVPLGLLLPLVLPRVAPASRAALAGLLLSLAIETLQLGTGRRTFDVDDLILNTAGAAAGALTLRVAGVRGARRAFCTQQSAVGEGQDGATPRGSFMPQPPSVPLNADC